MNVSELNRLVAVATGENLATIRRFGFSLLDELYDEDPDFLGAGPHVVDWDEVEAERERQYFGGEGNEPAAA